MKILRLFLLLLIPVLSSFAAHKYYLSVTDLVYDEEEKAIQMITRIFYDDLEDVLQERYDENILVDQTADQEKLDKYITKYVKSKIVIEVNGVSEPLTYLGKEYENDYVVCYIEVTDVESIRKLKIENTLLLDLFKDQKNMVHTDVLGKKKSLLLRDGNTKALLNFSE